MPSENSKALRMYVLMGTLFFVFSAIDVYASGKIITGLTPSHLEALMRSEGYSVSRDEDGDLVWKVEGFKAHMFIMPDKHSIQFHSAFGGGNANAEKVNKWNMSKRYSRTYLDSKGDPHLELDLDMDGGVTSDRIVDFFRVCRDSFQVWINEVVK